MKGRCQGQRRESPFPLLKPEAAAFRIQFSRGNSTIKSEKIVYLALLMKESKRREKLKGAKIKDLGILIPYLVVPFRLSSLKALCRYLVAVIRDFFFLQFSVKFGWRKIEVVNVDHPLDKTIPFRPDKSDTYLDFIHFWIRPFTFMIKRFGSKAAVPHLAAFLDAMTQAYREASRVYRFKMTTTTRPPHGGNRNLKIIHRLDPHFLCVPSLHIAVVTLTWTFFTAAFKEEGMGDDEARRYSDELREGALEIAETVLYLKQHSVNCVPAALYMMLSIKPELVTIQKAVDFIADLFAKASDINPDDKEAVISHIEYMFERLLLEGCAEDDWIVPVKRWIIDWKGESSC